MENHPMPEDTENNIASKLQHLIETIDIANLLTEPLTNSIHNLLETSAASLDSDEASVLIRDGSDGDLRFLSAIGKVADQLIGMKIPAGKGIAGFVLMSGQPMGVSDVGEEQTFYAEVDRATGYSTQTILATPLRYNGEVIGVLEYVNRRGEPPFKPFTSGEMDHAAVFADAIASLVNAHGAAKLLRDLSSKVFSRENEPNMVEIREWLAGLRDSAEHHERMDLAVLLRDVASRGEAERRLCKRLLESIIDFSDRKNSTTFLNF